MLTLRYFVGQIITIIYLSDYFVIHHYFESNMNFPLECYIYQDSTRTYLTGHTGHYASILKRHVLYM
jgi:hypothetical protein